MDVFPARALIEISETEGRQQPRTPNDWYWYSDGDYGGAIPFNINVLYRGQNRRYTPMLPSIARGLVSSTGNMSEMPPRDQALVVLRLAQSWWFKRQLDFHPIARHAQEQRLRLNGLALAQHYGIPTGYLDLSDNFDVSAFFATCRETDSGWAPVDDGVGVMYRIDMQDVKDRLDWLVPLGPQSLPRPEEQKGWVCELPIVHSFDGWPVVKVILFEHDPSVGEHFLKIFDGGQALFPPDPLAETAKEIRSCGEIPKELIENALEDLHRDPLGPTLDQFSLIKSEIKKIISVAEDRILLTDDMLKPFIDDMEWRKKRLSDVVARVRLVRG